MKRHFLFNGLAGRNLALPARGGKGRHCSTIRRARPNQPPARVREKIDVARAPGRRKPSPPAGQEENPVRLAAGTGR
ncbi:hypothetical protein [Paracoccus yeei]|uniref:hypothetical protein n=1 Tax=Paracoccus yeei TaxID=147645 RepID=UPI0011B0B52D|nr:hypothetical protein [Paracoccus yeei]